MGTDVAENCHGDRNEFAAIANGPTLGREHKTMKITGALFAVIMCALVVGCKPTNDRVPKADQSAARPEASTGANPTNDRTAAQQKLSTQLNEIDAKMADLKARAQSAGSQAKAEWEAHRPQLEAQREAAAKKLDELKQSSREAWDQTRTKTEAAFSELEKGFKEAWAKLKE